MTDSSLTASGHRAVVAPALRAAACALAALVLTVTCAAAASTLTACSAEDAGAADAPADAAAASAGGTVTAEPGVLVVASALNGEPYESATSTSQNGFTCDLLGLIGERAGLDVTFASAVKHKDADQSITPGTPEDVAAKVAAGDADLGASSLLAGEALEGVALTDPYLHADYAVATKMGTGFDTLDALQTDGVVVAVQDDPAIAAWVAENLPGAEVRTFENGIDALVELHSELAQAAIVDEPRLVRYVNVREPHLQAVEVVPSEKDYAFAVAAGNESLLAAVNEALAALKSDGSYDELYDRWFGAAPERGTAATTAAPESVQDSTGA